MIAQTNCNMQTFIIKISKGHNVTPAEIEEVIWMNSELNREDILVIES